MTQTPIDTTDELEEALSQDEAILEVKKKSVSGAISYFGRSLFLQGIGLVSAALLTKFFAPEDFGVYGYVTQIIGLLVFFSDIGFAGALVQQKDEPSSDEYRTAFTVQHLLAWGIFIVSIALSMTNFVRSSVGNSGVWVLLALGISFPLTSLKTIPSIQLERKLLFSKLVIPQIIEQIIFYVLLIFLAARGAGVIAYAYAIFFRSLVGVIVMFLINPWIPGFTFRKDLFKKLFKFGSQFQLIDLIARVKDQLFFLLLGKYLPLREFGYVNWSKNWSLYPYNLTVQNVMAITFPTFSRLQHNSRALQRAIEKSLFFITALIFPILIGMCIFIQPLLKMSGLFEKWQPAVISFILFTLSIGWSAISSPLTNALTALGKVNITLKLMLMWTGLTWSLGPLAVWYFGYDGVAISSFVIAISSLVPLYFMKKFVEIHFVDQVWRQFIASIVMAVIGIVGMQIWESSVISLIFGMMAVSLGYGITFGLLGWKKILSELKSLRG